MTSICSRRSFTKTAALGFVAALCGCARWDISGKQNRVIDIHQHAGYNRNEDLLLDHQDAMGITKTILLPSGSDMTTASTLQGGANGLQAGALGNEECYRLAKKYPRRFHFGANEVPDAPNAAKGIERYLKLGAVAIAEQKFSVECDAPYMQRLYAMAADFDVPILMHWQHGSFNHGFERFHRMLERFPRTRFIGHAQTWWANIDRKHVDQTVLYPKGSVTPGGLTDHYLADYANMYGDLSAGSGLNALLRDEEFTRDFLRRHRRKLMYGSDCNDRIGKGNACQGAQTLAVVRRLADPEVQHLMLNANARAVFKI